MSNNLGLDQVVEAQASKELTINNATGQLDAALTEILSTSLAAADATISGSNYERHMTFVFTGASVARTVTFPAQKKFSVVNNTGTHSISLVVGSTTLTLAASASCVIYSDGTTNGLIEIASSGAAVSSLSDVTITSIADQQFLRYDAASSKWINWNWAVTAQTADYTFALADASSTVEFNKASAINGTVPPNASVAFPVGTIIELGQIGAGALTVVAGAGVTINATGGTLAFTAQHQFGRLRKVATNTWNLQIWGSGGGGGGALSGLSDVNVTEGSGIDGLYLKWDNGTSKWIPGTPTGGGAFSASGSNEAAWTKPIAANFTVVGSSFGSPTVNDLTTSPGGIRFDLTASANGNSISAAVVTIGTPASAWTATARLRRNYLFQSFLGCGMVLRESATAKAAIFGWSVFGPATGSIAFTGFTSDTNYSGVSAGYNANDWLLDQWVRVQFDGTNLLYSYSCDGQHFIQVLSETPATHFTTRPNQVGIGGDPNNATTAMQIQCFSWTLTQP